jgi:hypothetical protein
MKKSTIALFCLVFQIICIERLNWIHGWPVDIGIISILFLISLEIYAKIKVNEGIIEFIIIKSLSYEICNMR